MTRTLQFALLAATLLLVAGLGLVLTLDGASPAEDDPTGELISRRPGGARPAELPTAALDAPLPAAPAVPAPLRPETMPPPGPDVLGARVLDDETGAPVPAFSVKAVPHDGTPPLPRLASAPENPQPVRTPSGVFRLHKPPGRWDVVVQAPGYLPGELLDVALPRPDLALLELRLARGPCIAGVVRDDSGLPVADAPLFLEILRLEQPGPPPRTAMARSDEVGRFRFGPLPPGLYSICALEPGSADRTPNVPVSRGTTAIEVWIAPRNQFVAAVSDAWGRPLAGAVVELRGPGVVASEATNDAGQARLRFLKPGRYDLSITHPGHAPLAEPLELQGRSGEIVRWYTLREGN